MLVALVVFCGGGVVIDAGLVRLSVRSWLRPLVASPVAGLLLARFHRVELLRLGSGVAPVVERHAAAMVIVLGAAAAAHGVAFGGSDAAGYVSQAALFASGRVTRMESLSRWLV